MIDTPKFIQGVFPFSGQGLDQPFPLQPAASYKVPYDRRAQLLYCRAGNSCEEMIYLVAKRDGKPMRYFPLGAKANSHVSLTVVEDLQPETTLEVWIAAPQGVSGSLVLDLGLVEI